MSGFGRFEYTTSANNFRFSTLSLPCYLPCSSAQFFLVFSSTLDYFLVYEMFSVDVRHLVNRMSLRTVGRCSFHGTATELKTHVASCQYEAMKDYIEHTESRLTDLQQMLQQKDQEITFLRSMLGKLSEKVESLEKTVEGLLTFHLNQMLSLSLGGFEVSMTPARFCLITLLQFQLSSRSVASFLSTCRSSDYKLQYCRAQGLLVKK